LAARPGDHRPRLGERQRGEQGVEAADEPETEEEGWRGKPGGDLARGTKDADQDGVSDQRGDAEGDA
jgi:hypothetical protein